MPNSCSRIWEIDFFRGIALLLMVVFHLIFDLTEFWGYKLNYMSGFWYYEGKLSAIMFMVIAGVSSTYGASSFRRGLTVFSWGMLITATTYFYNPQTFIRFGILHMLGSCMMLFSFTKHLRPGWLMVAGTAAIVCGQLAALLNFPSSLLLPFGITPFDFSSLDYYPLLPWSGFFLYGNAIGNVLYGEHYSSFTQPRWVQPFTVLGKYSLPIYLIHQPALLSFLYILHCFTNG